MIVKWPWARGRGICGYKEIETWNVASSPTSSKAPKSLLECEKLEKVTWCLKSQAARSVTVESSWYLLVARISRSAYSMAMSPKENQRRKNSGESSHKWSRILWRFSWKPVTYSSYVWWNGVADIAGVAWVLWEAVAQCIEMPGRVDIGNLPREPMLIKHKIGVAAAKRYLYNRM